MTVHDAERVVRGRFGGETDETICDHCRRHIKRGRSNRHEQLQGNRTFSVVTVEPRAVGGETIRSDTARGDAVVGSVSSHMCVNCVGVMMVGARSVRVRVHKRKAERSKRDRERQADSSQRPAHTAIVGETHATVKLAAHAPGLTETSC